MHTPTFEDVKRVQQSAEYRARRARVCARIAAGSDNSHNTREQAKSYAVAKWRRRRDAECAVSRMLDDGRPRFERRFGNSAWTVRGVS